jgi:hypothetical protein
MSWRKLRAVPIDDSVVDGQEPASHEEVVHTTSVPDTTVMLFGKART